MCKATPAQADGVTDPEVTHGNVGIRYTISLGIAELDNNLIDHTDWIDRADNALYHSKEAGRNQVAVSTGADGRVVAE